jgi:hypothetical protein
MASQSRTDIAFGFWDPWMGNGMDGIESKQRTAALGGHATDLYTAASVLMFLRHQVLDDDRMFRTIRSGLALYSSAGNGKPQRGGVACGNQVS